MGDERKFTEWHLWRAATWAFSSGLSLEIGILTGDGWRMARAFAAMATILGLAELVRWLARHLRWVDAQSACDKPR